MQTTAGPFLSHDRISPARGDRRRERERQAAGAPAVVGTTADIAARIRAASDGVCS
jgi:hypothetical protein